MIGFDNRYKIYSIYNLYKRNRNLTFLYIKGERGKPELLCDLKAGRELQAVGNVSERAYVYEKHSKKTTFERLHQ